MTEHIRRRFEDGVLRLTFARPDKKNAITNAMYGALADALEGAEADPNVRVVLFDAEGEAFTAGNDLTDFAAVSAGSIAHEDMQAHRFLAALACATKPYVAAVHGFAIGVGTTLLLHCDLVYVADDARLSAPFVSLALVPEAASSWLMPARIGYARAFAMFALGEVIDGRTAVAVGIANAAAPAGEVHTAALEAARKLARQPLGALRATKSLMRDAQTIQQVMNREGEVFGARLQTAEAVEAFKAFAERRAPDFTKVRAD
ncbi:MAG: enoyl-CoA hydratase [Steroidobacteraceae bacterium]|jgi:enoyl-CoA hydratase/carnithine racemase|nr:enoyl-CoA hydratase [Steroidobacteraceae bacterium]